ncbi:MAG: recombination regulator RecX [Sarcina sp.]
MNKITNIEIQKRNKDRVNVYANEEFLFACDAEFIYKEKLNIGSILDLEKITNIVTQDEIKKCKNAALRIIERNYKTEKEVLDKLLLKGYDKKIIVEVLKFLKEYSFIDDEKYANMYIRDKMKIEGLNKIKYSLLRKGISDEIIKRAISENSDENIEFEVAFRIGMQRYKILSKRETDEYKISQKLYRFLVSKGYGFDLVSSVMRKITNEEEKDYES